jgi:hypothetical protein
MTQPHPTGGEETPCLSGGILYVPEPWRGSVWAYSPRSGQDDHENESE